MSKLYKYSQFNMEVSTNENGDKYIFNTYTCKGKWLDKEDQKLIIDKLEIDPLDIPESFEQNGLVVPTDLDELQRIKAEHAKAVNNESELKVVIATTQKCNYRCRYCFMTDYLTTEDMSSDIMNGVVDFIISEANKRKDNLKIIRLQWFGGEPLLNLEGIRYISSNILKYSRNNNIKFESSIITNGSLLTPEVAIELHDKYNLVAAQISIDSLYKEYSINRGINAEYFEKLIKNIEYAQYIINISIRVNVINKDIALDVIKYIKDKKLKVRVNYHNIWDMTQDSKTYLKEYEKYINDSIEIDAELKKCGYDDIRGNHTIHKRCIACMANTKAFFVIDIYGNLYRCLEKINDKKYIIGNIYNGVENSEINAIFIEEELPSDCSHCNYLPLCYGKCTTERIVSKLGINCDSIKRYINSKITFSI